MDSSLDFKRGLASLWAQAAQGQAPSLEASRSLAFKNPYRNSDPLSDALAHLVLKNRGLPATPWIPRVFPMPVSELCQLALLWSFLGEETAAASLAHSIPIDFPWMWCRENEYREKEALASIALLSQAMGKSDAGGFDDPYWKALSQCPKIDGEKKLPSLLEWTFIEAGGVECCISLSGNQTSVGALRSNRGEIRAFGPQAFPLSDPHGFGIRQIKDHEGRWASFAANPEVWFELNARPSSSGILLELAFFGLKPNIPLAFSFYVKASSAMIGSEKIKPKTLQRYHGVSKPLRFGSGLCLESLTLGKMEVIPLAGEGGYWDSEYLAAFEIHPINAKMAFSLYLDL